MNNNKITKKITLLDGGLGRELKKRGAPFRQPEWSALAMMETPDIVSAVHNDFIQSGARVIATNSYALVPFHIGDEVFQTQGLELIQRSGQVARQAADNSAEAVTVAGSLPPLFGSYRADYYQPDKVKDIATPLIKGLEPYVDIWLAETQSLIAEPQALKALLDELGGNKPFWVAFTLEDEEPTSEPVLRSGESVVDAVKAMHAIGVEAVLFNCCQPETIADALRVAKTTLTELGSDMPLGAYANAFSPRPKDAAANADIADLRDDLTPIEYLSWAKQWQQEGASLVGGCCGIGPEHIAVLAEGLV